MYATLTKIVSQIRPSDRFVTTAQLEAHLMVVDIKNNADKPV